MSRIVPIDEQQTAITNALAKGPMTRPQIQKKLEKLISRGTVDNRVAGMVRDGQLVKAGQDKKGTQLYALPSQIASKPTEAAAAPQIDLSKQPLSNGIEMVIRNAKLASLRELESRLGAELETVRGELSNLEEAA